MEAQKGRSHIRLAVMVTVIFAVVAVFWLPSPPASASSAIEPQPTPPLKKSTAASPPRVRFSEFPHNAKAHQMACASCHKFPSSNWNKVRTGPDAFADITEYPSHASCTKCHAQQFYRGARPAICSICHVNAGPRNGTRHPFPNPREIFDLSAKGKTAESDFVIGFPHDKHIDIVSSHRRPAGPFVNVSFVRGANRMRAEESCSVCHKTMEPQGESDVEYLVPPPANHDAFWLKKGTFKSTPTGHATCFTCHSADSGMLPAPENCGTCHKLKPVQPPIDLDPKLIETMGVTNKSIADAWRRRDSSGTFRHEWFSHAELSCSTCHNVLTMNTLEPATKKVGIAACATCHATPTADDGGAINFEMESRKTNPAFQCSKCHITFGTQPVPQTHNKALSEATGK